jgi:single-stranded-DNA-specific exonuclease
MRRIVRRRAAEDAPQLLAADLHPVLRRVYAARGVTSREEIDLSLQRLLPVSSLGGVAEAVALLVAAYDRDRRIVVVGDFDADGATSTALVVRQLRRLGFRDPDYLVPNRFRSGYGLTPAIVRAAAERQPQLLVTVDNGIASHEGVEEARRLGIDVLITDHHLPGNELPAAAAIVNPNLAGESFASKSLAGVGVAFYVMAALTHRLATRRPEARTPHASPADLLDLVALGTVADVVPLDLNNRILVSQGLRRIRAGRCVPGIRALLEVAGRRIEDAVSLDLGYQVAPRLNAAGRLDDMRLGIECLLTASDAEAKRAASELSQLNADRRVLEAQMQLDALGQIDARLDELRGVLPAGVTLFDAGWHQGVIGLVAGRIKERLHRPVVAFAPGDDGWLKGSARSVPGVHVRDVLDAMAKRHPGLLERFGGHAMAAGMTLRASQLADFERAFADEVARHLDTDELTGDLHTDGELEPREFEPATARALRDGGPWGAGFPEPLFDGRFGVVETRVIADRHLKLRLRVPSGPFVDAIVFRHFDEREPAVVRAGDAVELAFRVGVDEYGGTSRIQLVTEWLAASDAPGSGA